MSKTDKTTDSSKGVYHIYEEHIIWIIQALTDITGLAWKLIKG